MTSTDDDHWVRSWAAAPQRTDQESLEVAGSTLRQEVRLSCGGSRVRIRFTNESGGTGLKIGAARVGIAGPGGAVSPGSDRPLTFAGARSAYVPAGAPAVSDAVDLVVPALATLVVSVYLPGGVKEITGHNLVAGPGWIIPGDETAAAGLPAGAEPLDGRVLLSGVETLVAGSAVGIVAIGSSGTDGAGATNAAGGGWPERLAARFARASDRPVAVANQGISGNRLLNDGFGASILARLDRDVLALPGVTHLVLLGGMNDLAFSVASGEVDPEFAGIMKTDAPVGTADVLAAYRQIIERAHARGVTVFGGTLTPCGGSGSSTPDGEAARLQVNDWIRGSGAFDAVLDFDAVWRDPEDPSRMLPGFDFGDHQHGNDAGHQALAASIDLGLFGG
ncbi:SGNH/GDSL hydrolase family protein [Amycolatopsis acidicola]|uniref:SGNH/GDSL hydrolase family protein n=1 Tax=Amycolatopsis acidicola TaxID=2596893 RepID=A0A5N0UKR6_9PSEU|nr:SGNH/GDSL hydrolase family protein [Amycolatopsis acidicola]KAA9150186.1 SGNH/GDSL hydrolase family protein [Amycolatopsis acidicola]